MIFALIMQWLPCYVSVAICIILSLSVIYEKKIQYLKMREWKNTDQFCLPSTGNADTMPEIWSTIHCLVL